MTDQNLSNSVFKKHQIQQDWTLFLDRDGVINELVQGKYIDDIKLWNYTPNGLEALVQLSNYFKYTFVVTNQQGIGKELMTEAQLSSVHQKLNDDVNEAGGKIHHIYHSPYLEELNHPFRKPNTGMALQAQQDFKDVEFKKSIMVGDFITDMQFAERLGMVKVFIQKEKKVPNEIEVDFCFENLWQFAKKLIVLPG